MAYEPKDNSGALFKNDRREKETHPHYKGDIRIDGRDYWLSAWLKESKTGTKFMSLSVTPKEESRASAPAQDIALAAQDQDIPF